MTIIKKSEVEEIEMDLTGVCNLSCPLCSRNYQHANHLVEKNVRTIEQIKKQLDQYTNLKRFFVAGVVSEPTMYKDFIKFIEYLNSRDIYYEIFTNGNTRDVDWWEKLGSIVPEKCMCCFTICGSTQELHSKYRIGSDLQQILDNAAAFRKNGRKNDWVQHIRFVYNAEDRESPAMQNIFDQFSNVMKVETEGVRRKNVYNKEVDPDIRPIENREKIIKLLFKQRPKPEDKKPVTIQCRSLQQKKIYINQWGQPSACYTHAENELDYFPAEGDMDYSDILSFKFPDCFLCEKKTRTFIDKMKLDFVC
jgi:wyosine [tRNA(Phe)-imidazoG37] synthetase (radical SAM superfamily)